MAGIKISDTNQSVTLGSRADLYWQKNEVGQFYKYLRPKLKLPNELTNASRIESITKYFKIDAVGFGNWVTIEDRINYVNAMVIAFYDLNKVLKFNRNIGLHGNLSVSFGARGSGRAMAHYEPSARIINITRYKDGSEDKALRFVVSGGVGAFAHEYGHFLDYFFGSYIEKNANSSSLTNGRSVSTKPTGINTPMRIIMDKILLGIMYQGNTIKYSNYYNRLRKLVEEIPQFGDYFIRRNEIFARAFEVYIMYELKQMGITNKFLTSSKYEPAYNLKDTEIIPLIPLFRELIKEMRKYSA